MMDDRFPTLAPQRDLDAERRLPCPTLGDWLGGIAILVAIWAGLFIAAALQ